MAWRVLLCVVARFVHAARGDVADETVAVVERFASAESFFIDTGPLGIMARYPAGTVDLAATADGLRVDFDIKWMKLYGYGMFGKLSEEPYQCADATHLVLKYRVLEPLSVPGMASLSLSVHDGSDCEGPTCLDPVGWRNEVYTAQSQALLDDASGAWQELRVGLCGDEHPASPFSRTDNLGSKGNNVLDRESVRGFWINVIVDSAIGTGNNVKGAVEYAELSCVKSTEDRCAKPEPRGALIKGAALDPAAAYRKIEWGHRDCGAHCAADDRCLYFSVDTTFDPDTEPPSWPSCFLFAELRHADVRPVTAKYYNEHVVVESSWVTDAAKRADLCAVCFCEDRHLGFVDCKGRDLATVPFAAADSDVHHDYGNVLELDLRENPRLALIGPGAFAGLPNLKRLLLPAAVAHLDPGALDGLARLKSVDFEPEEAPCPRNVVRNAVRGGKWYGPKGAFMDVCCGRGASAAGVTFCDFRPDEPGIVDAEYVADVRYGGLPRLDVIVSDSPFLAEASESREKCASVCARDARCAAFTFRDLGAGAFQERFCYLFSGPPGVNETLPPDRPGTFTSGLPPQTRAELRDASLRVWPDEVRVSRENGYAATVHVGLGADPLRGAVWATPFVPAGFGDDVVFDPPRVALYDSQTPAEIQISIGEPSINGVFAIGFQVESCDAAFGHEHRTVRFVVTAPESEDTSRRDARRVKRDLTIAGIIGACVVACALLCWLSVVFRHYAERKAHLEAERAALVQEQVQAARERVGEFQAHFAVMPGDAFVALETLKTHEALRDSLVVYDSVADVKDAMTRGDRFVFLSHQWLGYDHPDPKGVHFAAMRAAVRAVAADASVPLERVRVWVDVISIPQRNRSEQRLAIASLPTFASTCNDFVVIAPTTTHASTGCGCDATSFRRRAWCRAEMLMCWSRNGTSDMRQWTGDGLEPLSAEAVSDALNVFSGDLTCCRLGHAHAEPCDREELMLPMLGLYAELYAGRRGPTAECYAVIGPRKDAVFPRTFEYRYGTPDGEERTEEAALFGDLVQAVELAADLEEADPDDPDGPWTRPLPDMMPGTNAQRGRRHGHGKLHKQLSLVSAARKRTQHADSQRPVSWWRASSADSSRALRHASSGASSRDDVESPTVALPPRVSPTNPQRALSASTKHKRRADHVEHVVSASSEDASSHRGTPPTPVRW